MLRIFLQFTQRLNIGAMVRILDYSCSTLGPNTLSRHFLKDTQVGTQWQDEHIKNLLKFLLKNNNLINMVFNQTNKNNEK